MLLRIRVLSLLLTLAAAVACVDTRPPKITKVNEGPISVPARKGQINDYVGILDAQTTEMLERKLSAARAESGTDIVITIVPTTDGHRLEEHAAEIARQWDLNAKPETEAIVLLDISVDDQEMRVQVTKPLWDLLPNDELDGYQAELQHYFEADKFTEGISHFVEEILRKISARHATSR